MLVQSHVSQGAHHSAAESAARLEREILLFLVAPIGAVLIGLGMFAMLVATALDGATDGFDSLFGKTRAR